VVDMKLFLRWDMLYHPKELELGKKRSWQMWRESCGGVVGGWWAFAEFKGIWKGQLHARGHFMNSAGVY
jgi:hypothetical protein